MKNNSSILGYLTIVFLLLAPAATKAEVIWSTPIDDRISDLNGDYTVTQDLFRVRRVNLAAGETELIAEEQGIAYAAVLAGGAVVTLGNGKIKYYASPGAKPAVIVPSGARNMASLGDGTVAVSSQETGNIRRIMPDGTIQTMVPFSDDKYVARVGKSAFVLQSLVGSLVKEPYRGKGILTQYPAKPRTYGSERIYAVLEGKPVVLGDLATTVNAHSLHAIDTARGRVVGSRPETPSKLCFFELSGGSSRTLHCEAAGSGNVIPTGASYATSGDLMLSFRVMGEASRDTILKISANGTKQVIYAGEQAAEGAFLCGGEVFGNTAAYGRAYVAKYAGNAVAKRALKNNRLIGCYEDRPLILDAVRRKLKSYRFEE